MIEIPQGAAPVVGSAPPAAQKGQRLWAILLVLDSLFVIVFGGALAAKVYQHWETPPAPVARRRPPPQKPAPKPAEAPKPPEPAKPAPTANAKPDSRTSGGRPDGSLPLAAKPSLLNDPPRHEAAAPLGKAAKATPKPAPIAAAEPPKQKAQPVQFRLSAPDAKKVELSGAFIVHGGGRKRMARQSDGTWTLTLYLTPNNYRYHFLVDGKKTLDPDNAKTDRGASVMAVGAP